MAFALGVLQAVIWAAWCVWIRPGQILVPLAVVGVIWGLLALRSRATWQDRAFGIILALLGAALWIPAFFALAFLVPLAMVAPIFFPVPLSLIFLTLWAAFFGSVAVNQRALAALGLTALRRYPFIEWADGTTKR
ncbi:MAG TPA: hypothetical protein VN375_04900 [Vicinamibacteria bacterium]|jgi:hypothetical protein|nr:hypothetical protein [Vicinamibacteria bacterium]